MDIKIVIASEDDLEELLPLIRGYHEFENFKTTEKQRKQSVRHLLSNRSLGCIWKVRQESKLIGYIALCVGFSIEFSGLDAFVDEFYILPEYRGQGAGAIVLELVKSEAKNIGIGALHLEVARTNSKAQKLYCKANFKARDKYVLMSVNL